MLRDRCTALVRLALVESLIALLGVGVLLFLGLAVDAEALCAAAGFARF
jgi:hypothetical protein